MASIAMDILEFCDRLAVARHIPITVDRADKEVLASKGRVDLDFTLNTDSKDWK